MFSNFHLVVLSTTTLLLITPQLSAQSAQIATDGTLGVETSLPGPNFEISADLGQQHGGNLFHSFKEFNINTGETATFTGPDSVQNILTRVTGGQHSFIDGTLRSEIPNANLYLLNPSGVMFGPNASLDVSGSFHAGTADVLHLQGGGHFNAREPSQSLLTVASPEAFGFLNGSPAAISFQGNESKLATLAVNSEKTLSFIGGDLTLQDSALRAPSGQINLVAMASAGTVSLTADNSGLTVLGELGKINLSLSAYKNYQQLEESGTAKANLDASGRYILGGRGPGGHIVIRAGQFLLDQGRIVATTYSGVGGDIDIEVTEKISMENSAQIRVVNQCKTNCKNTQGGNVSVKTHLLSFHGRDEGYRNYLSEYYQSQYDSSKEDADFEAERASLSRIDTNNYGSGQGGDIRIQAVVLDMSPGVLETMNEVSENAGLPGDIEVNAQQVILRGGGNLNATTNSAAQAGRITINSPVVSLFDSSFITTSSASSGPAGNLELTTQHLNLTDAWITSFNLGVGPGGDITLNVSGNLLLNRSDISASAEGDQPENSGGNLTIGHPKLLVLENSGLFAKANMGKGGQIRVQADNFIHSYPFEEKEYSNNDFQSFREKMKLGFTLIDASSEKGLPGEVQMETKEWTFADLQPFPSPLLKLELSLSRCASFSKANFSRFLINARDILPRSPEDLRY